MLTSLTLSSGYRRCGPVPGANKALAPFRVSQPDRFGVLLLVVRAFASGSRAGQCFPAHEIVANNPQNPRH